MDKLEKPLSFRQQCEIAHKENNIKCSIEVFRNYAEKHGIDKAIYHYLYEYTPRITHDKSLRQIWRESNLHCTYDAFKYSVRSYPELTMEQVIDKLREPKKVSLMTVYKSNGLSNICTYDAFKNYVRKHPELTMEQVIYFFKNEYTVKRVKRDKSLKQVHAESGLVCTYEVFKAYVTANKDKSLDEIINYLRYEYIPRKEIVDKSLSKVWRDNKLNCNVNYFIKYVKEHPEEDIDSIVEKFKKDKEISLASVCRRENVDIHSIRGYMKRYNITVDEAIEMYRNKEKEDKERNEFKKFCEENGINAYNAWIYKNNHPGITNEEILKHYKHESVSSKCKRLGISYSAVTGYKQEHPELDYDTIIEKYLQPKELTFKEKCLIAGIHAGSATSYRAKHPELTDEQVIQYYLTKEKVTFSDKCRQTGISYSAALSYKQHHPELTDEQVIIYYRPECYINWLGELVVPT